MRAFLGRAHELKASPSRATGSSRYDKQGSDCLSPPTNDRDQVSDALAIACRCNRLEVARWLVERGADPENWRGYAGATCLAWAEFSGNDELAALLRAPGVALMRCSTSNDHRAIPKVFPSMVLARVGFDPHRLVERFERDPSLAFVETDKTPLLHAAAEGGHIQTVELLLSRGVERNKTNARGRTSALDLADKEARRGRQAAEPQFTRLTHYLGGTSSKEKGPDAAVPDVDAGVCRGDLRRVVRDYLQGLAA